MKFKYPVNATVIILFFVLFSCEDNSPSESNQQAKLEEKLQKALDDGMATYQGIGFSATVIFPDGETWSGATGISVENNPVTTDMVFSAGSITKMYTAVTILQLAEDGLLNLEDSLHQWLPDYANIDNTISIHQLLNHTSGIYNITEHPDIWQDVFADPTQTMTLEQVVTNYTLTPYFPKGTSWHYSNTGYLLLRMIIREATGSDISTEYRSRLFEPIGLENSYLAPEETLPTNTAQGWFDLDNDGSYDELPFMNSFYSMAGGGVFCTALDLAKWTRALLHDKTVLPQELFDRMITFISPCPDEPMVDAYGLGLVKFNPQILNNLLIWGHAGNALGYAAACLYLPDYNICVAVMDNTEEGEAMFIINDILEIVTAD